MGFRSWLSGNKRKIENPNFFGSGTVGGSWSDYLKELYAQDTGTSKQFQSQSTALRDALGQEAGGAGEKFAAATNAGGFYDSGARLAGLSEINRAKMYSYSQGLTAILAKLEDQKLQAAYPFLQAQIGGFTAYENALYQQDELQTQRKKQIAQTFGSVFGSASGGGGSGSMGNSFQSTESTGGYTQ